MHVYCVKAKTEEKYKEIIFYGFYFKTQKCSFWGSTNFFNFFSVLAFKTIDTQMLFWSVFLKTHKKPLLTAKNGQNGVFDGHSLFLRFQKYWPKEHLCVYCFFNLNQSRNTKTIFFRGGFLQKPKTHFFGDPKWYLHFKSQRREYAGKP